MRGWALREAWGGRNTTRMALQSSSLPVLITRPHPQGVRFAAQLAAAFGKTVAPVISPLIAPEYLWPTLPAGPFGALILTSETGARAAAGLRERGGALPDHAFCVGDQTAQVAQALGFQTTSAAGDAVALVTLLSGAGQHAPFLHLHGREVTGDIAGTLRVQGIAAQALAVYAQAEIALTDEALALLAAPAPVCVPLFSPRSARLFVAAFGATPAKSALRVVAMSAAVSAEIPLGLAQAVYTADHPDAASMVAAVGACRFKP